MMIQTFQLALPQKQGLQEGNFDLYKSIQDLPAENLKKKVWKPRPRRIREKNPSKLRLNGSIS
jgi:hypothetical protein